MDRIAYASDSERKKLFIETADKTGIADSIIEKDFWVSWILGKIFSKEDLSKILCFKGGTSLSKAFGLIDRFSEDIDLILSSHVLLKSNEILEQSSNSKQANFNREIEARARHFIFTTLKDEIAEALGTICKVVSDPRDHYVLLVKFPQVFNYNYIQPEIKLEIGPLALWDPNEKYPISSFIASHLPELDLENPIIPTVKPERTFWEKITILHHEHHRPETSSLRPRYSRHYYDVFKIGNSKIKYEALANLKLLEEVVVFKKRFYPRGWANYDNAFPGTIRLSPAAQNLHDLGQDYIKMQKMIFGSAPRWQEILNYLKKLEDEINKL